MSAAAYRAEVLAYLLGRLQKLRQVGEVDAARVALAGTPLLWWWILEGQRHPQLEGSLLEEMTRLVGQARRLLTVHSHRQRVLTRPEGRVDWLRSVQESVGAARQRYVCEVATVGLSREERAALIGWCDWIAAGVRGYSRLLEDASKRRLAEPLDALAALGAPLSGRHDPALRRRWAHAARRSRWPLLRQVVADSLRAESEPIRLARLPVPDDHPTLFELVCLVRALRVFEPRPTHIRWLAGGDREVRLPGVRATFQRTFAAKQVAKAAGLAPGAGEAIERFGVRLPSRTDLIMDFDPPRGGFDGALIEVKSGGQQYRTTVLQLQAYRQTLEHLRPRRMAVLGVVERPTQGRLTASQRAWLGEQAASPGDVWAFVGAEDLADVLRTITGA